MNNNIRRLIDILNAKSSGHPDPPFEPENMFERAVLTYLWSDYNPIGDLNVEEKPAALNDTNNKQSERGFDSGYMDV